MSAEAIYPDVPSPAVKSWADAAVPVAEDELYFGQLMLNPQAPDEAAQASPVEQVTQQLAQVQPDRGDWHVMNARLVALRGQSSKFPWERAVRPRLVASHSNLFPHPLIG